MVKQFIRYLRFVANRFFEDRCLTITGSLTYTTLVAVVPVLTVMLTLTAKVPLTRDFIAQVKVFIVKNLVPDVAGKLITVYADQFAHNASSLTLLGLLIIVVSAVAMLFTIDSAFNDIWRVRQQRALWKRLLVYSSLLVLGPLLVGASLSATAYVAHWTHQFERMLPFLDDLILKLVPLALTTAALVLAYRVMPNRLVPFQHALVGGMIAATLFEVVKYLFVAYVARMGSYSAVYGAFASVPLFLGWLYFSWMVVLIGAELTATLSYLRYADTSFNLVDETYYDTRSIVDALSEADAPLGFRPLRLRVGLPIDRMEDAIARLLKAGIVTSNGSGRDHKRYRLVMARDQITERLIREHS
ncbi:MAG: YihY family inner membrane protein [Betaproteobacteria bacterium]|nr:YihY family inner membrane protein [Betaproteobacteria bacterium]